MWFLLHSQITSSEDPSEKHADQIAQELKRIVEDDMNIEYRRNTMTSPNRRRTVHELTENPQQSFPMLGNFKSLFLRMLRDPNASGIAFVNFTYTIFLYCTVFILSHIFRTFMLYFIISLIEHLLCILVGLSRRISSQVSKNAFSAFERRRSTILSERRRTQNQKPYIYDDADNLRRTSNGRSFRSQPRQTNVNQFHYDNPGFKQDENMWEMKEIKVCNFTLLKFKFEFVRTKCVGNNLINLL